MHGGPNQVIIDICFGSKQDSNSCQSAVFRQNRRQVSNHLTYICDANDSITTIVCFDCLGNNNN